MDDLQINIIVGLILLGMVIVFYWINRRSERFVVVSERMTNNYQPLLSMKKVGGIAGYNHQVDFLPDQSYIFYSRGVPQSKGTVDGPTWDLVQQMVDAIQNSNIAGSYCSSTEGYDLMGYSITVGDQVVNLGPEFACSWPPGVRGAINAFDTLTIAGL